MPTKLHIRGDMINYNRRWLRLLSLIRLITDVWGILEQERQFSDRRLFQYF